jgi:hypothetical protein
LINHCWKAHPQKCHRPKKPETRLILIFDSQVRHYKTDDSGAHETQNFGGDGPRGAVSAALARVGRATRGCDRNIPQ